MAMSSLIPGSLFVSGWLLKLSKDHPFVHQRKIPRQDPAQQACTNLTEENVPESQCGFRANKGMTDMVFVLRQLLGKCREQNKGLYERLYTLPRPLTPSAGKASS